MCKNCELKPVYQFTNKRKLCKNCFVNYFNKKFLYTIRKFDLIPRGETVAVKESLDFRSVVLKELLEMFARKSLVKVIKFSKGKKFDYLAVPNSTDLNSFFFISSLFENKINLNSLQPKSKNIIMPLYLFLDKEIFLYAKIKGLKFKDSDKMKLSRDLFNSYLVLDKKKSILEEFLFELERNHPEINQSIIKSYLEII